jgi:PKD repeat protein
MRRKRSAPLRVRRLERRRVLDAAVADLLFAPADVDGSTAVHDSNEGTQVTVTANASGSGPLSFEWTLSKDAIVVAQSINPAFKFTPLDNGDYSVTLKITDSGDEPSTASRTESLVVQNLRPVLVVALDQQVDEGTLLDLSALGAPPLGLFIDKGILDTHTATVDWGDGSAIELPTIFAAAGSGALGGTHTYTDDGVYEVIVTVTDDDGGSDTQSFFVTVDNVAPTATLGNSGPVDEGASATVSFSGQFDPSSDDTSAGFHYAYDLNNDGTFDVGDGSYAGSGTNDTQMVSAALLAEGPGSHTVKARILDQDGGFTDYTTTITINNVAPKLLNLAADDDSIDEGQAATIKMTIDDPGAMDVFAVDVDWQDGGPVDTITGLGMSDVGGTVGGTTYQWDAQSRQLTVSHLYEDDNPTATPSDTYAVALVVRDDDLGTSDPYQVEIVVSNVRPVLVVAADQMVNEGSLLDLSAIGAPPLALFVDDGVLDTHTVTVNWGDATGDQAGTLIGGAGSFAVGGTHTYTDNGIFTVTVTATDDDGGSDAQMFTVTVKNVDPSIDTLVITTPIDEGQTATLSGTYSDPSVLDTHELDIDWNGDNVFDQTVTVTGGTFSVDRQYPDDDPTATPSDTFTVHVRLRDDDLGSDTAGVDLTVNNVRPVLVVAPDQTVDEGALLDLSALGAPPLALFVDDGVLDTHTVTVNWGDGTGDQAGTLIGGGGAFAVGGTHAYIDDGIYMVTVSVTDDDGGFDSESFLVTVENVAPTLTGVAASDATINEAETAEITATISDPGALDVFSVDVDWKDGGPIDAITGLGLVDSSGSVGSTSYVWDADARQLTVRHLYQDDNPTGTASDLYAVTLVVRDDDLDQTGPYNVDIRVSNVRPVLVVALDQTVNEGALLDLSAIGAPPLALFVDDGVLDTHTVTVNWGDSTGDQAGTLIGGAGSFAVGGTHTYVDDGIYMVTVTVTDDDGGFDTNTFQVTVLNVAPTLVDVVATDDTVDEGASAEVTATINDPGAIDTFSVDVDWHDNAPVDTITGLGLTDTSGTAGSTSYVWDADTRQLQVRHLYQDDNPTGTSSDPYTVTLLVRDDDLAQTGPYNVGIIVNNVRPVLVVAPDQTVDEGAELDLSALGAPPLALFIDSGKLDTHIASVNWGDGSGDQAVTLLGASGSFAIGADKHIYADNGVYTVTVTVTDDDGGNDTQTFLVNVLNVKPSLTLTDESFTINEGQTVTIPNLGTFTDPGFNNPLNPLKQPGGSVETFSYKVNWGDGQEDTGLLPTTLINGAEGVLTLGTLGSHSHFYADNDTIGVVDNKYTITVTMTDDDGGVEVQTFEVTVLNVNPTLQPIFATDINANTGTTTLTLTFSDPGADSFQIMVDWGDNLNIPNPANRFEVEQLYAGPTPNTFVIVHQYAGPPDPLNPTADIVISVKIRDDDFATAGIVQPGESNVQSVAISNPGIQTINVAIDTTPDVPRLDLTQQPMVEVFIPNQGGLGQLFQVPDVRGGGGEVAATTERYLELRIVYPDGSESAGYRITDEALADLRKFFKTLPDGRYAIYLVRTENHSERLVIEVDVRHGRVIDVSDDSEGTRDRPPTDEGEAPDAVPLDQNPLLETVPGGEEQTDIRTNRQGESVDQHNALSSSLFVSVSAAALAVQPWSRRVDEALAEADENAWRRLRRAGRAARTCRLPRQAVPPLMRTTAILDYNRS